MRKKENWHTRKHQEAHIKKKCSEKSEAQEESYPELKIRDEGWRWGRVIFIFFFAFKEIRI